MLEDLEQPDEINEIGKIDFETLINGSEETKALAKNHGKKLKNLLEKWCE